MKIFKILKTKKICSLYTSKAAPLSWKARSCVLRAVSWRGLANGRGTTVAQRKKVDSPKSKNKKNLIRADEAFAYQLNINVE